LNQAEKVLSGDYPTWFEKLGVETKKKLLAFYSIAKAADEYISKKELSEQPTYNIVSAENVIAFPFTYKIVDKKDFLTIIVKSLFYLF